MRNLAIESGNPHFLPPTSGDERVQPFRADLLGSDLGKARPGGWGISGGSPTHGLRLVIADALLT